MVAYLALVAGIGIHQAAATSLFSFLFTGLLGTWLYQRRGTVDWRISLPVCAGAVVFGFLGAACAALVDAKLLSTVIALIIVAAGIYIFVPQKSLAKSRDGRSPRDPAVLLSVGAASGFGSGLSGAGGPLFSVPLMVILGYVPLTAIATSQVLQVVAAISGSIENMRNAFIDWRIAAIISVFELAGVMIGVRLAHAASANALRALAGVLCIASGGLLLARSL
jgi:uncharacterized membrane protein YfcA